MTTTKPFITNVSHMDFETFEQHLPEYFTKHYQLTRIKDTINIVSCEYNIWTLPWSSISHIEEFDGAFTIRHSYGFISFFDFGRVMTANFPQIKNM